MSEIDYDRDRRLAEIVERLDVLDKKLDEVFARVKKSNSLVGMMVGRLPAPKKSPRS